MRGCGLRPVGRRGAARRCGDPPFWVLCDSVDDTCTKDAIGSDKQDLAFCDACFRSSGHDNSFQIELIRSSTAWRSAEMRNHPRPASVLLLCYFIYPLGIKRNMPPN